jgi:hypothetical protein
MYVPGKDLRPCWAKDDKETHTTGSATAGSASPPLHPWLQPEAPPGNAVNDFISKISRDFDPGGIVEVSRGLSAATPPEQMSTQSPTLAGVAGACEINKDLHLPHSAISSSSAQKPRNSIVVGNWTRVSATPVGVGWFVAMPTGGVAALDPRLISVIPPGSKNRSRRCPPGLVPLSRTYRALAQSIMI